MAATTGVAAAQQADDGLDIVSDTLYKPMTGDAVVDVVSTIVVTNERANTYSGNYYTQYYYDGFSLALPVEARGIVATVNGTPATVNVSPAEDFPTEAVLVDILFPRSIFYGQQARIELEYRLFGGGARDSALVRANDAYLAFPVWLCCDDGQASVRVEIPAEFDVDVEGSNDDLVRSSEPGIDVFVAENVAEVDEFFAVFFARNDAGLDHTQVMIDGREVTISSWPDDPEWRDFVAEHVETGIPAIEELTGLEWPRDELELVETVTPYLYGYAGWYNTESDVIEVGDQLEAQVILHELSHAWFNDDLFTERWITEGLAEIYSNAVLETSGEDVDDPRTPRLSAAAAEPLNSWGVPLFADPAEAEATEAYGYNASWFVLDALADEIGLDAMREVLVAVDSDQLSYLPTTGGDEALHDGPDDWRRLLDLVEERGGSTEAEDLLRTYVLRSTQMDLLNERTAARDTYQALIDQGGAWEAPVGFRIELTAWRFADIDTFAAEAAEVLGLRDQIDAEAERLGLTPPTDVRVAYEGAVEEQDLASVKTMAQAQLDAMALVEAAGLAIDVEFDFWTRWGLRSEDLDAEYADVVAAFDDNRFDDVATEQAEIVAVIAAAPGAAKSFWTKVAVAAGVGLVLLMLAAFVLIRRRRRRPEVVEVGETSPKASPERATSEGRDELLAGAVELFDAGPPEPVESSAAGSATSAASRMDRAGDPLPRSAGERPGLIDVAEGRVEPPPPGSPDNN